MENADPKMPIKAALDPPKQDHVQHQGDGHTEPKQSLHIVKHLGKEAAIGIFVALVVASGTWAGSAILPEALDYGCSTASEVAVTRGYRYLERRDAVDARREAEDIVIVQPTCAKAHALWAEAAAAVMGAGANLDDNDRRLARREGATAERLGFRSNELDAILAVTEIANPGA